jgi:hypothetical protein
MQVKPAFTTNRRRSGQRHNRAGGMDRPLSGRRISKRCSTATFAPGKTRTSTGSSPCRRAGQPTRCRLGLTGTSVAKPSAGSSARSGSISSLPSAGDAGERPARLCALHQRRWRARVARPLAAGAGHRGRRHPEPHGLHPLALALVPAGFLSLSKIAGAVAVRRVSPPRVTAVAASGSRRDAPKCRGAVV